MHDGITNNAEWLQDLMDILLWKGLTEFDWISAYVYLFWNETYFLSYQNQTLLEDSELLKVAI